MRWIVVGLALASACRSESPDERPPPPPVAAAPADAAAPTRSLPPPPPPPPEPMPPPAQIAAHLANPGPATATLYELGREGRGFANHVIKRQRVLSPGHTASLFARLGQDASYMTGDIGCFGDPFGLRLARGTAQLDLVIDCGHVAIGDDDHAAILSMEMIEFLETLRRSPR